MPRTLTLPHNWTPRPYQEKSWNHLWNGLSSPTQGKRTVLNFHRRAGKDELCLHFTAVAAHKKKGNYWYMLPEYGQARKSMWDAINSHTGKRRIDEVFPDEIRARGFSEQEMMIPLKCGSTFQLIGSDNYKALIGSPPIGLVFSEYKVSDPNAWAYLRPILLENGGWAIFNSTPQGKNHFYDLCKLAKTKSNWFYQELRADQSGVFTPDQLQSELEELQSTHGPVFGKSLWLQEYFCSFDAAILGSIFGEQLADARMQNRIRPMVPHLKSHPVHTAWDLGRSDDTAIWFYQNINNELRIIDYHESNFKDMDYYINDVLSEKIETRNFTFGNHALPHDARIKTLLSGGQNIIQQFISIAKNSEHKARMGNPIALKNIPLQHQIQAARKTLKKSIFDESTTEAGLEHLKNYKREFDEDTKTFRDKPKHDESSHAASAFCTLSCSWRDIGGQHYNPDPDRDPKNENNILSGNVIYLDNKPRIINPNLNQMRNDHLKTSKGNRKSIY